jgi:hypothetical protein
MVVAEFEFPAMPRGWLSRDLKISRHAMSRLLVVTYHVAQTSRPCPGAYFTRNSAPGNFEDVASTKREGEEGPGLPPVISSRQLFIFLFSNYPSRRGLWGRQPFFLPSSPIMRNLLSQKLFLCKLGLAYIKIIFASLAVYGRNFACVFAVR